MSATVTTFLANCAPDIEVSQKLSDHLAKLPPQDQLDQLLAFFHATTNDEALAYLGSEAWRYLVAHALWSHRYPSLGALQQDIAFVDTLKPILERHDRNTLRIQIEAHGIQRHWHCRPSDAIPPELAPPRFSAHLSRQLHALSRDCPLQRAIPLLRAQVTRRLLAPKARKEAYINLGDIVQVRQQYKALAGSSTQTEGDGDTQYPHATPVCSCPSHIATSIKNLCRRRHIVGEPFALSVFHLAWDLGLTRLCRPHLRTLASLTVGLYHNVSDQLLIHRLAEVHLSPSLPDLRHNNSDWFQKSDCPESEADYLVVYRYPAIPPPDFQFDPHSIFRRFGGLDSWTAWERDGTIIIPDVFSYLNRPDLIAAIDTEFDMYRHHYRPVPGRPQMGFLRNMFYSLTQQLIRQDPVLYAWIVAARPDHCWRLITYPYIAKYALKGNRTGFLHLDLNIPDYIDFGRGGNIISSSISLDGEDHDGCTLVVPGFHRHIQSWHERRDDRGKHSAATTTDCSSRYRQEHRAIWGPPVAQPCPAFGLRLTRPEIIHGSTTTAPRRRRVIYTWHTGIHPDHLTLENPGNLDWNEVAACHRDLEAPVRGVGGEMPTHSVPPFRFPAALLMESSYALGDALLGRRKWNDPEVLLERDILLGADDNKANQYIAEKRRKLLSKFHKAFAKLEAIERSEFGENSFFLHRM